MRVVAIVVRPPLLNELRGPWLIRQTVEQIPSRVPAELLAPIYSWFTEGFETHDLRVAREMLRSLD